MAQTSFPVRACRAASLGCKAMLMWIPTKKSDGEKKMPCETPFVTQSEPNSLPEGMYCDIEGNVYTHRSAPVDVELYRTHWDSCVGEKRP